MLRGVHAAVSYCSRVCVFFSPRGGAAKEDDGVDVAVTFTTTFLVNIVVTIVVVKLLMLNLTFDHRQILARGLETRHKKRDHRRKCKRNKLSTYRRRRGTGQRVVVSVLTQSTDSISIADSCVLFSVLPVLLTELGIHQSRQRTLLSKHMPAKFKADGNKAGEESEIKLPPLTRIDRPHFRPVFVELPAAGKGCTVRNGETCLNSCPSPISYTPVGKAHNEGVYNMLPAINNIN